jgi:hypothetical protein
MTLSAKLEHALLDQDEIVLLRSTHHPEIYALNHKLPPAFSGSA